MREEKSTNIAIYRVMLVHSVSSRFSLHLAEEESAGTHACAHTALHNAARCYKENLEAENHPRRAFQLLKSLQRRSAERISRVSKLSIVARCVPRRRETEREREREREREIKREPTPERSPSLRGLCSCFLSRLLCFPGSGSSRFLYGPRVHA